MIKINHVESAEEIAEAQRIFREYEVWIDLSLCFQNFDAEVANLPGMYSKPDGRLLLATLENNVAGCVGLRKLDDDTGEIKRLYVRPEFRGHGIGKLLIESFIAAAREIGYKKLRLDTFPPKMGKAVKLYEAHGFYPIEPYYHNPHEGTLFMEMIL